MIEKGQDVYRFGDFFGLLMIGRITISDTKNTILLIFKLKIKLISQFKKIFNTKKNIQ